MLKHGAVPPRHAPSLIPSSSCVFPLPFWEVISHRHDSKYRSVVLCPAGTIFRCIDPTLTIAAGLSFRSPFVAPFEKREEADKARKAFAVGRSDHLTLLKAFDGWVAAKARGAERQFCLTHFLSANAMRMIAQSKRQFVDLLLEIGFLQAGKEVYVDHKTGGRGGGGGGGRGGGRGRRGGRGGHNNQTNFGGMWYNANSHHLALVKAVICAGLYPNIVRVLPEPPPRYLSIHLSIYSNTYLPCLPHDAETSIRPFFRSTCRFHPERLEPAFIHQTWHVVLSPPPQALA